MSIESFWEWRDPLDKEVVTKCREVLGPDIDGRMCVFIDQIQGTWTSEIICHFIALQKRYEHLRVVIVPNGIHTGILKELGFKMAGKITRYEMMCFDWKKDAS